MDVFPSFWERMGQEIAGSRILILDKVKEEVARGKDWITDWLETTAMKTASLKSVNDSAILAQYAQIMEWAATHEQFTERAKVDFAGFDLADPWLVACGIAEGHTIVSEEVSARDSKAKIKLPDVCTQFGVRHLSTMDFLREIGYKS